MRIVTRGDQQFREHELLSPDAAFSDESDGRDRSSDPDFLRNDFQRDRDKILHTKSFRRLSHKTQVFLAAEGDHFRTRLTHTLEVSQIARTIARALGLNEDLAEAISLGHDLGHTPFGHTGEDALCRAIARVRGVDPESPEAAVLYRHNEQSLRMVERLEREGAGLNLCQETRDGILCHSGPQEPSTLEGWCVRRADRIAYISHDIDDAIRGGILKEYELPRPCVEVLGKTHGERINTMIADVVRNSEGQNRVVMSDEVREASDRLREFLFENVYLDEWRKQEEQRCDHVVNGLFDHYVAHPEQLPGEYLEILYLEGAERAVCDFIAGMTDRYAICLYQSIFIPKAFNRY